MRFMAKSILQTNRLTKAYGSVRDSDNPAMSIAPGETLGLLAPNGPGKATASRLLMGFLRPTSGEAFVDGHNSWMNSVDVRRKVANLPGELRLYESMTGRQLSKYL